jgi:putative nucleotidyltransferase with HDIG domain
MTYWVRGAGYAVTTAECAADALGQMERDPAAVAVCDIGLPDHDGLWLADKIRRGYPETAVVMSTGSLDVDPAVESLRQGVVDYLTKPFGRDRLREALGRGADWHASALNVRRCREVMTREVTERQARLGAAIAALRIDSSRSLDAMLAMATIHDRDAYNHAQRVAALAVRTARTLWLDGDMLTAIEHGALLHDIGKLAIPSSVLSKPAALTPEEQTIVRMHPSIGSAIVGQVPFLAAAAVLVRDAHERVDGFGFPSGSRGAEVSIGARIIGVADAFDTMTRPRSYRGPVTAADALEEIERCSGTQFDRQVGDAFRRVVLP